MTPKITRSSWPARIGFLPSTIARETLLHKITYPGRVDQCSWEPSRRWLACAGGGITLYSYDGSSDPKLLGTLPIAQGVHTNAIDPSTGTIWTVWSDRATGSASIQGFTYKP